ncbi:MAG: lectin, partial [Gemmatimonadetes bacterium]|nr:lectin [Gemmatimonadota bacterium]
MRRLSFVLAAALVLPVAASAQKMSFFITSAGPGNGADLGGLEGADRRCKELAESAGVTGMTWHAYLSAVAMDGKPAVNARDRIGKGPWYNAKGVMVAANLEELHGPNSKLGKETSLTEKGMPVNGRGDTPNTHDILTGSRMDGTVATDTLDTTCRNWTSSSTGSAWVGHHD